MLVFSAGCEIFLLPRFPEPVRCLTAAAVAFAHLIVIVGVVPQITADERVDVACCTYRLPFASTRVQRRVLFNTMACGEQRTF